MKQKYGYQYDTTVILDVIQVLRDLGSQPLFMEVILCLELVTTLSLLLFR